MPPERAVYARLAGFDVGDRLRKKVADLVVRTAGLWPGDRAFEAACGPALLGVALAKAFTKCRVAAVDAEPAGLAAARRNARTDGGAERLALAQAEAGALPFKDETFLFSCAAFGLSTLDDPAEAVAEIHRVTAFYGKVLLVDVDLTRVPKKPRGIARRVLDEDLEAAMREMGYGKIQRQKIDLVPGGAAIEALRAKRFDPDEPDDEG